jgi:hypothetical protein
MDDGAADVAVDAVVGNSNNFSLPEQLMKAEQSGNSDEVRRILDQVHYLWPQANSQQ